MQVLQQYKVKKYPSCIHAVIRTRDLFNASLLP